MLIPIPLFIYLFSHLSTRSPPILLGLLALYLFMKKRNWILTGVPLGLAFLFSPETGLIFWLVLVFYSYWNRAGARRTALVLGLSGAIALAWYVPFFMQHGFLEMNALHTDYAARNYGMEQFSLDKYIWETGYKGLPLLVYLLAFAGLYYTKDNFLRTWLIFCLLIPLLFWRLFIYVLFPAVLLAALGLNHVYQKLGKHRREILTLFALYLVFASIWFMLDFSSGYPKPGQTEALLWMRENIPQDALVLSDWPDGHWVTSIAYRKAFIDGYAEYAPEINQRVEQLNLFLTDCTVPEGVDYIFLEWWMVENRDLDCVFGFEELYNKSGMYIFRV